MKKDKTMVQELKEYIGNEFKGFGKDFTCEIKEYVGKELKGFRKDFTCEIKAYVGKELKGFRQDFGREIKEYVGKEIEEVKRHTGVLVEGLRSDVRIVAEQHGGIMRKLEEHDVRFDSIDLDLKGMKVALFDNSHRLTDHDARIRKLETS